MTEKTQTETTPQTIIETPAGSTTALAQREELNLQATEILNQIITERDADKVKDLTYLFNISQNKKTMARVDKCNDVLDGMLNQWAKRVSEKPDEMSNEDLLRGVKTIQDLMERGQRQVAEVNEAPAPFIQINQQNNEVNIGEEKVELNRNQRERVKKAVMDLLASATNNSNTTIQPTVLPKEEETIIEAEVIEDGK